MLWLTYLFEWMRCFSHLLTQEIDHTPIIITMAKYTSLCKCFLALYWLSGPPHFSFVFRKNGERAENRTDEFRGCLDITESALKAKKLQMAVYFLFVCNTIKLAQLYLLRYIKVLRLIMALKVPYEMRHKDLTFLASIRTVMCVCGIEKLIYFCTIKTDNKLYPLS